MMFFYGTCKTGKRLHMGVQVLAGRGHSDEIETYCGNVMFSVDLEGDIPPAHRVDEFCKSCFRTYAWNKMVNAVAEAAQLVSWFEVTVTEAREQNWSVEHVLAILTAKADYMRPVEQPENVVFLEAAH